jgi:hypothetical protein
MIILDVARIEVCDFNRGQARLALPAAVETIIF